MNYFELLFWVVYKLGILIIGLFEFVKFNFDVSYLYICPCQTRDVLYYVSVNTLQFCCVV